MITSKVPRAELDHAVARAFDAESTVVVSVRDTDSPASVLVIEDGASIQPHPSPALQRIWKRVELEWKACIKRGVQASVRVSFLQLQGSSFRDLLSTDWSSSQIKLRDHDTTKSPHIFGADEVTVSSESEMFDCFRCGARRLQSPTPGQVDFPDQQIPPPDLPAETGHDRESCLATSPSSNKSQESHLIFSVNIHLQGPLTSMPAQHAAKPKTTKPSGNRRKARGPPKPVDEWIYRSVIRCVDVCVPDTPPQPCSPSACAPTDAQTQIPALNAVQSLQLRADSPALAASQSTQHQPASRPAPCSSEVLGSVRPSEPSVVARSPSLASATFIDSPSADIESACNAGQLHTPASSNAQLPEVDLGLNGSGIELNGSAADGKNTVAEGDSPGWDSTRKRVRDDFEFTAPARVEGGAAVAQGPGQEPGPRSPHHEVGMLVGLQTSARRLRKSQSSRAPVVMSLVTGAAARAPSVQLRAADAVEERAASGGRSGVEALEGVMRARQQQKAMLPFRAHLLSRILRPAINGTAHCVTVPTSRHLTGAQPPPREEPHAAQRAAALQAFFAGLQAHSPRRDAARLDAQSDVVKWMQLENRSLKGELKTAREQAAMLQRFVASHGAQEVKTWELWRELETVRTSAATLRAEADTLQTELHSARSTAAAAEAAAEMAGERAAAEATMRAGACREAASAAARAAAMEAAADRMARQLADTSGLGWQGPGSGDREPGTVLMSEGRAAGGAAGGAEAADASPSNDRLQPAVSVQLNVVEGQVRVCVRPEGIPDGSAAEGHRVPAHVATPLHALHYNNSMPAHDAECSLPADGDSAGPQSSRQDANPANEVTDVAQKVHDTLSAALAAAAQQHTLRCAQAQRAAAEAANGPVAPSSVLSLLALLVRSLTPLAVAPSMASPGGYPRSDVGVTPSASACSLEVPLGCQQLEVSQALSHAAAQSFASASEVSPRPSGSLRSEPSTVAVTPAHRGPLAAQSSGNLSAFDAVPGDARSAAESPWAPLGVCGTAATGEGCAMPDERTFEGLRTAWPADLAVAPGDWVSALVTVLQLPRVLDGQISSLASKGEEAALELQHLQMQQQQAVAIQSVLLTPFKSPSPRTLYALWGWLRPPPQKGQPSAGAAAGGCSTSQLQHSESEEQASSMAAEAVPHDSEVGSPGREAEPWWALAGALHEVVCSLGRQQTQLVQVIREQRESEVCLLQDSIKAYQVSSQEHMRLHSAAAQHAASMQAQCEDAVSCARVFDETVANLVAAKMAHASADAALRAMRDQVEALSAQVPLSAGQSTARSGDGGGSSRDGLLASMRAWGRRSRGSGELPGVVASSPGGQEAPSPRQEGRLPAAMSRSAAIAKSALSGISSYFTTKAPSAPGDSSPQA